MEYYVRTFFRFWFPIGVVGLTGVALAVFWAWPDESWGVAQRNFVAVATGAMATLLLAIWFFFLSGLRWTVRLAGLLVLVGAAASVQKISYTGDMVPILTFRWERTRDDILEEHRRQHVADRAVAALEESAESASDFPEYRNRKRDGVVSGPPLTRDWKTHPPKLLWQHPLGGGYSGFAVAGNAAVTLEQRRDWEAIVCYDTVTGRERWVHTYDAYFSEMLGGDGPRATPTISNGAVYSLGATGWLVRLDLATGREKWAVKILDDEDNVRWGMSGSPLVFDVLVVVNPGVQGKREKGQGLVAYHRRTREVKWSVGGTQAGFSSPMLANLAGRRQLLLLDGEEIAGHDPGTGEKLWRHPWKTEYGINVAQPLVLEGDRVFVSSGYGVGCALFAITESNGEWRVEQKWSNRNLKSKFASPVFYQGYIYGLDEGVLVCLDAQTGERKWKANRYGHGQLLRYDDLLVILAESGKLALVQATPDASRELGSIPVFKDKTWNPFAIAGGKVYLRNDREMACYDLAAPN